MSLRTADPRFVLPSLPRTAVVLGDLDGWRSGLGEAGVALLSLSDDERPELVVAPSGAAAAALSAGAPAAVLAGRNAGKLLRPHYARVQRFLPLPDANEPQVLVPIDDRNVTRYVLRHWSLPRGPVRRLRNALAELVLTRAALPDVRPSLAVGTAESAAPRLVQEAAQLGVPLDADWFLTLGHGDVLTRAVFHLFPRGSDAPAWILKFARVPGYSDPFDRDERALRLVEESGAVVAAHAPRLLGRFEAEGLHAAVETAAVGRKLTLFLQRRGRTREKQRLVDAIAAWLLEVALATRAAPEQLEPERKRLREAVLPFWSGHDVDGLLDEVPAVPAVLQHNDPGSWNIIVDGPRFTLVDWESARPHGLPLWDLAYFLTDALVHLDGEDHPPQRRDRHFAELWLGRAPSSALLLDWVARAADAFELDAAAVAAIVTLGWLHHGTSPLRRAHLGGEHGVDVAGDEAVALRAARVWLSEPGLGRHWRP